MGDRSHSIHGPKRGWGCYAPFGFSQRTCRSLDRDRRAEGPVRHPARHRRRRPVCIGVARFVCAFDTVDHDILIRRLKTTYGVTGMVSQWFQTYLVGQRQYVRTRSSASSPTLIVCGVPKGSVVLGPILFLLYTAELCSLIQGHGLSLHLYADDMQIYGSCQPSALLELQNTITNCVDDVSMWMRSNRLQLNTAKTEILWSTTGRRSHQLPQSPL